MTSGCGAVAVGVAMRNCHVRDKCVKCKKSEFLSAVETALK
jgi:hypothetical protein